MLEILSGYSPAAFLKPGTDRLAYFALVERLCPFTAEPFYCIAKLRETKAFTGP
jgi:hypothetical protein